MRWILRFYLVCLLGYTGWRSFDFIQTTLPEGNVSFWLAFLFLFATEVGLAIWHEISMSHTTTYTQQYIANTMTWIDFIGSFAAGTADMILHQTLVDNYAIPWWLSDAIVFGFPAIVAANVGAALIYLQNDADTIMDNAKKQLEFEARQEAVKALQSNKRALTKEHKDALFAELITRKGIANTAPPALPTPQVIEADKAPALPTPKIEDLPLVDIVSTNGHTDELNPTKRRKSKQD